jgi:alpha-beta hydrolase superfamily lysophospholipase
MNDPSESSPRQLRVRLQGGSGFELAAQLELATKAPLAFAVFAPCFTCLKDSKAIVRISRRLALNGFAVLRYDVTGIGQSAGDFAATSFRSQVEDLVAAARYLRQDHTAPVLGIGISLGGAVVLAGAHRMPELGAVATINSPADTVHLHQLLKRIAPQALSHGFQEITLLGSRARIGRTLIEDLAHHDIEGATAALNAPLLVLHAPQDSIVPFDHARRLCAAAARPASLVTLDGADHLLLSPPTAADFAADILARWATYNLTTTVVSKPSPSMK